MPAFYQLYWRLQGSVLSAERKAVRVVWRRVLIVVIVMPRTVVHCVLGVCTDRSFINVFFVFLLFDLEVNDLRVATPIRFYFFGNSVMRGLYFELLRLIT